MLKGFKGNSANSVMAVHVFYVRPEIHHARVNNQIHHFWLIDLYKVTNLKNAKSYLQYEMITFKF